MKLEGMHHVTMITGDAQRNVDFYADVLGLRLVKKTVNFDAPEAYHLYFGDERGSPGSILTWFEFAGARRGRPGAGMIHTLQLGVASEEALDFWAERLSARGHPGTRAAGSLAFEDDDGLRFELVVAQDGNPPLRAEHPDVPAEHAILGVEGARAYAGGPLDTDAGLLTETLGFTALGGGEYRLDGDERHFHWGYDEARERRLAAARRRRGDARHPGHRPRLLQVDLLPPAAGRPVRDRHHVAGLRGRRGSRAARREAAPADPARAPAPAARAAAGAAHRPA
jgi:glyoxalase family protein